LQQPVPPGAWNTRPAVLLEVVRAPRETRRGARVLGAHVTGGAFAIAGDRYARYLCDRCDKPIGPDGTVALTTVKPLLVWGCWCVTCRGQK
jgi:hypothetical protein